MKRDPSWLPASTLSALNSQMPQSGAAAVARCDTKLDTPEPVTTSAEVAAAAEDPSAARRSKALQLAARILEFDPDVRGGQGYTLARDILESGRALEKMRAIIAAQGKSKVHREVGHLAATVKAKRDGQVIAIDNLQMARLARLAGAPMDAGAGVDLCKKVGDSVRRDEPLYTICADFDADFGFALEAATRNSGFKVK